MRKYFKDCETLEDVKKTYRKLAKELHPDVTGREEEFKQMVNEYEKVFEELKKVHRNAKGETYTSQKETTETAQEFAERINAVIHLEGVIIEIIGSWVWISGNTYEYRQILRAAGYEW